MESERKTVKFDYRANIENSDRLREELAYAMVENKRVKRLVDLFLLALFLLFITYTTL